MGLKLFGKSATTTLTLGAAMLALVGNESASAEQVDAANQELDTAGIKGAQLVPGAVLDDLTAKADRVDTAEAAKAEADKKNLDLTEANQKLTDDLAAEKKKTAELGKKPGAESTTPVRADGKTDIEEKPTDVAANQKIVDDLHAKMLGEL